MVDCNAIIEGAVKIRDGKKWKSRWCLMTKLSPVADCLHLQLYRDSKDRWKLGQAKTSLSLQHFLGLESGFTLDKESNTIAIICQDSTVVLGFDTRERLVQWQVKISKNLGEGQKFMVQVVSAPSKSKLSVGPARLHVRDHCFSLTSGLPPRVLGSWDISHLRRYGVVDGGRFCFEGGSRCGKGEGVHVLATAEKQGEAIVEALRLGSQGRLLSITAPASPTPSRPLTRNFSAMESPQRLLHSRASDTSCTDSISGQHSMLCSSNARLGQSLGEVCSERVGVSLSAAIATCGGALQPPSTTADSWVWNSSIESCFSSSPSPSCCFHATLHHHLHHHHHMHHHHCNVMGPAHPPGPVSPTTPILGLEGVSTEVSGRDGCGAMVAGAEARGERGLVVAGGGGADGASLSSHGSGGESEYSVPPRYSACPPAKSASSSSSASTASTSTCSSLSCSWYDRPRLCRMTNMLGGAVTADSSHAEASGTIHTVKGSSVPPCFKYHHPLPATLPRGHMDAYENYDVPKNVLPHSCVMMENKRKISRFPRDNLSHSSISAYCDHYDTPRKLKETLGGAFSNGASDESRFSAISNYDTPARIHHLPRCCADHSSSSLTTVNVPIEQEEVIAKQHSEVGEPCQGADVGTCSPSLSRRDKNESAGNVVVKDNSSRKCSPLGLSLPHNVQKCPYSSEMYSHYTSGACCYAGPNFYSDTWPSRMETLENGKKNVQMRPAPKNQSALYENLNFAQSLEHYENVKEILVRTELDEHRKASSGGGVVNDEYPEEDSCHERGVFSNIVCKKCGHSLCCPVRENESMMRPGSSSAYGDSEIYNNLPAPAQPGAYNSGSESTNQSPKKHFLIGRLSEKSASIPSLTSSGFEMESGMLSQKSRYNYWQRSSAPNLSQGEGNFIGMWDYHIRQLASTRGRGLLTEEPFSLAGCYSCNCQELMSGCLQGAKVDCPQTNEKLSQHHTSLGTTSCNSSVVSSTSASVASLQLPANQTPDSCRDLKKVSGEKLTVTSRAEEEASGIGSNGGSEAGHGTGSTSHGPAASTTHIVRRTSGNPGRPGGGSAGNRDSSGSNDSGVSSTGSVGGGLIMGAAVPQFPNRSSSPLHPRCRGARFLSHPSPCCFHASLPHPRSNCNLQTSPMHSQPHLNSLRSRSSSDPLRHLSFSSPIASTSGLIDLDVNLESSKSSDVQRTVKYNPQKGGAYSQH